MQPPRRHRWAFVLLLVCAALSLPLAAQQPKTKKQPPQKSAAPADPPADNGEEYNISVQVQVVAVPVTVTDRKGKFVTDLDKGEFTVFDNGQAQKIENFELASEPLSVVLVVETSGRVATLLPDLRKSGILITQLILGESGEAAVLTFDREVKIAQDFTDSPDAIEAAMKSLATGPDQTHLSDAVGRAVFLLQRRPRERRKVIIVISEARDQGSKNKLGAVLRGAQQLGISVYTVGLSTMKAFLSTPTGQNVASSPYPPGVIAGPSAGGALPTPDNQAGNGAMNINGMEIISDIVTYAKDLVSGNPLSVYAAATGGASISTENKGDMEKALTKIGEELRNQYLITYHPSDVESYGFHPIKVTVARPQVEARFRPGYVLVPQVRSTPSTPSQEATPANIPSTRETGNTP